MRRLRPVLAGLTLALLTGASVTALAAEKIEQVQGGPVLLTSDTLDYDTQSGIVTASGHVELTSGDRRLFADTVSYNRITQIVTARGNITLLEPTGEAVFGDSLQLQSDLREGFIEKVRGIMADGSRFAADKIVRSGGDTEVGTRGIYSPCPRCADGKSPPLWQIKARTITHDNVEHTISYRDAFFELGGVPILWTPYMSHPDPTVKRKSGFLAPSYGSSPDIGQTFTVPYFWNIAPNRDITFAPIFTTEGGQVLAGEFRNLNRSGLTTLGGSAVYTTEYQAVPDAATAKNAWRGHIKGDGVYRLNDQGYDAGYNVFLASDDTYLQRYGFSEDDVLTNRAYVERAWDRNYAGLNSYYFQGLRSTDIQSQIPFALPLFEADYRSEPGIWGSSFRLRPNLLALTRTGGLDTRRASMDAGWQLPHVDNFGGVYLLDVGLRSDIYNTNGDPETFSDEGGNNTVGRVFPRVSFTYSLPLVRDGVEWHQRIEPVIAGHWTPENLDSSAIPNEDSQDLEFDDTNLFDISRFSGIDEVEVGPRVSYGLRFGAISNSGFEVSGLLGQSYRVSNEDIFPTGSGLEDNFSDYVGRIDVRPGPWLNLSYRFQFDNTTFQSNRSQLGFVVGPNNLKVDINYLQLTQQAEGASVGDREEVTAGITWQVLDNLGISARVRRDLTESEYITNTFGLVYNHPCLVLLAGIERNFTQDRDVSAGTSYTLRVLLKNLGEVNTGGSLAGG